MLGVAIIVVLGLVAATVIVLSRRSSEPDQQPAATAGTTTVRPSTIATPPCKALTPTPPVDEGSPTAGGTLVVGLADESDGYEPSRALTPSGLLVASAIYDPLAQITDDGTVEPFLATSIDHNADFTEFTITLAANVTFHDGSALDAKAVEANWAVNRTNKVTGPAFASIEDVTIPDDLHLVVRMKQPWPVFPMILAGGFGYVESPAVLGTPAASKKPVGTGPFMYKDWRPGAAFVVTRNPSYWRGEQGPFVDTIEFRPIVDDIARVAAYEAGDLDVIVASDTDAIAKLQAKGPTTTALASVNTVALNTSKPPFDDPNVRRALALATDQGRLAASLNSPLVEPLGSPFPSDSAWCVDDPAAPGFDLAAAKALAAEHEKATGKPITFELMAPSTAEGPPIAKALIEMWDQAGIKATLKQFERTSFGLNMLGNNYAAAVHTFRPIRDPDTLYDWFHSTALPVNDTTLNLTRITDPAIDKVLEIGRVSSDVDDRKAAYAELVRLLNKDLPYLWLYATPQTIVAGPRVRGATALTAPLRPGTRPWAAGIWLAT